MKLIFLDIDGVIATKKTYRESGWYSGEPLKDSSVLFCDKRISLLRGYLELHPDVKVVISSSWRLLFERNKLIEMLGKHGFPMDRIIGFTPDSKSGYRGDEIKAYLTGMGMFDGWKTNIVILDDDSDLKPFRSNWIQTTFDKGLTKKHIERMDKILYGSNVQNDSKAESGSVALS